VETILDSFGDDLLAVKRRHFVLVAFQEELEKVSKGKAFWIWNDVVWLAMSICETSS
jgi:hypothetical protein